MPQPRFPILPWAFRREASTSTSNVNMTYTLSIPSITAVDNRTALNVLEVIAMYKIKSWWFEAIKYNNIICWISCS